MIRVTVKNGGLNPISRAEMQSIVKLIPSRLTKGMNSITLCYTHEPGPYVTFHQKESSVCLYGYSEATSESAKLDTIKELFVSLTAISELGDMPKRITNNKWNQYLSEWESELETCKKIFDKSAT